MTDKKITGVIAELTVEAKTDATIARLRNLKHGERLIYHTGQLAHDRTGMNFYTIQLNKIANAALNSAEEGYLCLVQKKIYIDPKKEGRDIYEYIAVGCGE